MKIMTLPLALAAMLSGCATPPSHNELATADYGPRPSDYQAAIKAFMGGALKDPESARYDFFRAPVKAYADRPRNYGWATCVRVNSKNSYGGYTGMQLHYVLIRNDSVVRNISGDGTGGIMDGVVALACDNLGPAPAA